MMKLITLTLFLTTFFEVFDSNSFAEDNSKCLLLKKKMSGKKEFPKLKNDSVIALVTWRSSTCEKPPVGNGVVTALCEGQGLDGATVFFWEKNDNGNLISNFLFCRRN
jgi:hypothetical protein